MIQIKKIQKKMISMLEEYTGLTVVPANTTKQMPAYPYVSFSLINISTRKGTYSVHEGTKEVEGVEMPFELHTMPTDLKYSFTVQSDDDVEALIHALSIKDFFEEARHKELATNGIIVADVGGITPRDNMLTIEYEYRKGLDVTIHLTNDIEKAVEDSIESVTINNIVIKKE